MPHLDCAIATRNHLPSFGSAQLGEIRQWAPDCWLCVLLSKFFAYPTPHRGVLLQTKDELQFDKAVISQSKGFFGLFFPQTAVIFFEVRIENFTF
jgi:hypothetical protein